MRACVCVGYVLECKCLWRIKEDVVEFYGAGVRGGFDSLLTER